jgi:hypothetical protein
MTQSFINKVSCKYGAPMGRHTGPYYLDTSAKVYLRKIALDSGGYDKDGAYWGFGYQLWEALDREGNGFIFRAGNRDSAKLHILSDWPDATFYR